MSKASGTSFARSCKHLLPSLQLSPSSFEDAVSEWRSGWTAESPIDTGSLCGTLPRFRLSDHRAEQTGPSVPSSHLEGPQPASLLSTLLNFQSHTKAVPSQADRLKRSNRYSLAACLQVHGTGELTLQRWEAMRARAFPTVAFPVWAIAPANGTCDHTQIDHGHICCIQSDSISHVRAADEPDYNWAVSSFGAKHALDACNSTSCLAPESVVHSQRWPWRSRTAQYISRANICAPHGPSLEHLHTCPVRTCYIDFSFSDNQIIGTCCQGTGSCLVKYCFTSLQGHSGHKIVLAQTKGGPCNEVRLYPAMLEGKHCMCQSAAAALPPAVLQCCAAACTGRRSACRWMLCMQALCKRPAVQQSRASACSVNAC